MIGSARMTRTVMTGFREGFNGIPSGLQAQERGFNAKRLITVYDERLLVGTGYLLLVPVIFSTKGR